MLNELRKVFQEKCHLEPDKTLVLGFSGGPDSLCLFDILQKSGYSLILTHLDHQLRPESNDDALAIQDLAKAHNLEYIIETADVAHYARQKGYSTEEAARELRYSLLFRVAQQYQSQAVVVGHNADDQIETVLMHLLRGTGMAGLVGMSYRSLPNAWSDSVPLVRPLLGVWRKQILAYIEEHSLQPILDASNLDTTFYRNRIRHELIPYMESYNPRLRELIWRMAEILGEDNAVLQIVADEAWHHCHLEAGAGFLALSIHALASQPTGIQRRVLRRAIAQLRPSLRDIDYRTITEAVNFVASPTKSGKLELIAGMCLRFESDRLWLSDEQAELPYDRWPQITSAAIEIDLPDEIDFVGGWKLHAQQVTLTEQIRKQILNNTDPYQAWLDLDHLKMPLSIRTRHPGDRIQPLGMEGKSIKLSDLMVNVKIPHHVRDHWPLVVSSDKIAWIPGVRLAHPFRVTQQTERTVHLNLKRS